MKNRLLTGVVTGVAGAAIWIIAASADRIFNGADAAGIAVLVLGVMIGAGSDAE